MKINRLLILFALLMPLFGQAQMGFNSGVGITPKRDLEMYTRNGFQVQIKHTLTTANPNASVNTMSCVSSPNLTAFAGILKDPAGDGPYTAGIPYSCSAAIAVPTSNTANLPLAIEFTFSQIDTESSSDRVIIEGNAGTYTFSGSTIPPAFVYPSSYAIVRFITNNNAIVGQGFRLQWRSLIVDPGFFTSPDVRPVGYGLYFQPGRAIFRAGFIDANDSQGMGFGSSALGVKNEATGNNAGTIGSINIATGNSAMALGYSNEATQDYAVAMGYGNVSDGLGAVTMGTSNSVVSEFGFVRDAVAIGGQNKVTSDYSAAIGARNVVEHSQSYAIGYDNVITVNNSVALGTTNRVSASNAVAIGTSTSANSGRSVALGSNVSTNHIGAFTFGDFSTTTGTPSTAQNQFTTRFAGGYRLFSNAATTLGVQLAAGGNAWSAISDSTKKERFLPLNHANLLTNIRALKLGTWNYKGQRDQRHYGPMAQEFFARFGHDALGVIGCDTLINSHDFTAVTLSGVQALAIENEQLKAEITKLKRQAKQAERERTLTATRLEALERMVMFQKPTRTYAVLRSNAHRNRNEHPMTVRTDTSKIR